ncbi:MAG: acyl-CoA dehydratase activase-related protein [Mycoplasmatota bacterium]|nr:acyl-CoA dehydratase activase-related protein [Mycoplasmatota bacterium]
MKKIKIGIPRAMLYYRYGVLWKNFFELLGLNVVLSPQTNREILTLGTNNTIDECCLSYKIYIGHALYLSKICDYILVSRVCDYGKKDKVCTRLNGTYDNLKHLIPQEQLIDYNIDHTKRKYEFFGFLKMGLKFTKNIPKIIYSYLYAKEKQKQYDKNKANEEKNKLTKPNKKILIMSHFYNIQDKFISNYITTYLENNNLIPIYSNNIDKKTATTYSEYFSNTLYWKYSKEMVGSFYYYQHQIDGVIYISTYPCGVDALVNNLLMLKNKDLPTLNLLIDENITELSLETKLESFIDIIKGDYYE